MEEKIKIKAIKISLLGDSTVGKTAISYSFLNVEFREGAILTVGIDKLNNNMGYSGPREISIFGIKNSYNITWSYISF
jgi:GTPase SAR1 family protein